MYDMKTLCVCVTLCDQHPDMIGTELPKWKDAGEADGTVAADAFSSLIEYNVCTTVELSGKTNNILSFKLVPTNPDNTPALSLVDLHIHMYTYWNHNM